MWTTVLAFLSCKPSYLLSVPRYGVIMIARNKVKLIEMKEFKERFTIRLDDKIYSVIAMIQPDESVVFTMDMDGKTIEVFRGENDDWFGNADQNLINSIGKAIEEG